MSTAADAAKVDRVLLKNGDWVTGEIKELRLGVLKYSTDSMETVYIDWVDVVRISSPHTFHVELDTGQFEYGTFVEPETDYEARVMVAGVPVDVDIKRIVRIDPIEQRFWKQFDGSISLGFSFTRASDVAQLTLGASAKRRRRKHLTQVNLSAIMTSQDEQITGRSTSRNNDLTGAYTRFLKNRWTAGGNISFQQNDELGIDLRTLITGLGGRKLVQSIRQLVVASGGLAYNNENTTDREDQTTLEGVLSFAWIIHRPKRPETDLNTSLLIYPSITEWGRLRGNFDTTLRRELIKDFFWDLQLYATYDSDPPTEDASTTDYGIVTSFGYSF